MIVARAAAPLNEAIARQLDELADRLTAQRAAPRRVRGYRRGAHAVRALAQPVDVILHSEGLRGLIRVPAIGEKLARVVRRLAVTGDLPLLDRLRASQCLAQTDVAPLASNATTS
jgi:DNA polymerase/3'-5' exonuclease PolX